MKTTRITVSYAETASLPGYNNIRPSVGFEVEAEGSDKDIQKFTADLLEKARGMVQAEIDREKGRRTEALFSFRRDADFTISGAMGKSVQVQSDPNWLADLKTPGSKNEDEEELPF